jgi:hypothetical protein
MVIDLPAWRSPVECCTWKEPGTAEDKENPAVSRFGIGLAIPRPTSVSNWLDFGTFLWPDDVACHAPHCGVPKLRTS